jgi:hypothetical protein
MLPISSQLPQTERYTKAFALHHGATLYSVIFEMTNTAANGIAPVCWNRYQQTAIGVVIALWRARQFSMCSSALEVTTIVSNRETLVKGSLLNLAL